MSVRFASWLVAIAGALAVAAVWIGRSSAPPSIVVIAVDTLRSDALGIYGCEGDPTPHIDRIARGGFVFDAAYATSGWTLPSFASALTGLYPDAHGATSGEGGISEDAETIAERLHRAGYRTAAFTGGGWVSEAYGFDQGFEVFETGGRRTTLGDRVTAAISWLQSDVDPDEPFFLFLHSYDPHDPYAPEVRPAPPAGYRPPPVLETVQRLYEADPDLSPADAVVTAYTFPGQWAGVTHGVRAALDRLSESLPRPIEELWRESEDYPGSIEWMIDNYRAEVRALDPHVGRVLAYLEANGRAGETAIVFVSDHGEAFMEHGRLEHRHLDDAVVRVPLLIRLPEASRDAPATRIPDVVSLADLAPTLAELAGAPLEGPAQGRSLLPLLEGEALSPRPAASFVTLDPPLVESALRDGRYRLLIGGVRDPEGSGLLFDRVEDPLERENLAAELPDRARDMQAALQRLRDEAREIGRGFRPANVEELDRETRARLEELGYLGRERK